MKTNGMKILVAVALGLAACGSVSSNGGNDVPSGPAVPVAGGAADCTRDGTGIDATLMPVIDTGVAAEAVINPTVTAGVDTAVPFCLDTQTQQATAPAMLLTSMTFSVKDGVVQAPSGGTAVIQSQWFEWGEPTKGTCQAMIFAVVNVTDGSMPTCSVTLQIGSFVDAPISTYTVQ